MHNSLRVKMFVNGTRAARDFKRISLDGSQIVFASVPGMSNHGAH
jgi:hypothetical protein